MTLASGQIFRDRLSSLLDEADRCCHALAEVLDEERRALESRAIESMTATAARKAEIVGALDRIETERMNMVSSAGYDPTPAGFSSCLSETDPTGTLNRRWAQTLELLERCQHDNRLNGAIVEASRHFIEQALGILRGSPPPSGIYSPNGRTTPDLPPRPLAMA